MLPECRGYRNEKMRKGYRAVVRSGILNHIITNDRLARRGYYDISEAYKSMHSILPNYRVRNRTHGSVSGQLLN